MLETLIATEAPCIDETIMLNAWDTEQAKDHLHSCLIEQSAPLSA